VLLAQLVPSKTYYDFNKTILKEKFFVQKKNPTLLDSTYLLYYQHGQLKTKGNFKNNKAHGTWLYYYENGSPKMEGTFVNGEQSGYWIYYYENGHKSMEGSITKDIKQGTWIYYYENGNKKNYGPYINNKKDGVWLYFGEDGNTKAQAIYKNDQGTYTEMYSNGTVKSEGEIKDGKSNGIWRYYYEDGKLKAEGEEKDGVKNGYWKFYHRNDSLASEGYYKNGLAEGNWKYYYENGNVSSEGPQKDGQKNGYWKLFYPSGASKGSATFENGNGTYREYYESGKLKTEGAILQDKNEGLWNYYYESGAKEGQCFFNAGTGKYRGFYEDGGLKMEGLLRNGIKDSIWVLYKENGQVAGYYTTIYENDVPYFRNVDSTDAAPKVKRDTIQPKEKPGIRTVKRKSRYFSPKINEFKGLIASVGMIGLVKRTLSLNLEFYYQERQGIELNLSLIRSPFFGVEEFFPTNQLYRRGFSMSGKIKLYERDHDRGMFYFGHELRYTRIRWSNRIIDSTVGLVAFPISKIENTWEYFFNVGDRLMQDSKKPGFTLDLNAALGIGYRSVQPLKNYPESYERFFDEINKGQITRGTLSIRPRVEITVGYVFKNKNRRF
jgi:antitoxin component YwqK of YwqJK toxin-antitoxin module